MNAEFDHQDTKAPSGTNGGLPQAGRGGNTATTAEARRDWANIPKQRFLVQNGEVGDCWRCCIAAVIGRVAEEVPHFLKEFGNTYEAETQKWLNDHGWLLLGAKRFDIPRFAGDSRADLVTICCGPTERSRGFGKHHAVVMSGWDLLYDPHPSNAGLTFMFEQFVVVPLPPL